jgi:hypothetical protein
MSKHTPGPWKIRQREGGLTPQIWTGERGICRLDDAGRGLSLQTEANARLIAESPAMLTQLRAVAIDLAGWMESDRIPNDVNHELALAWRQVMAVIEAATGQRSMLGTTKATGE